MVQSKYLSQTKLQALGPLEKAVSVDNEPMLDYCIHQRPKLLEPRTRVVANDGWIMQELFLKDTFFLYPKPTSTKTLKINNYMSLLTPIGQPTCVLCD